MCMCPHIICVYRLVQLFVTFLLSVRAAFLLPDLHQARQVGSKKQIEDEKNETIMGHF